MGAGAAKTVEASTRTAREGRSFTGEGDVRLARGVLKKRRIRK